MRIYGVWHKVKVLAHYGMPSFVADVGMGVVATLFNRSIMQYFGADALAVYGVLAQMTTVVQANSYGIGQAAQPLISMNFGATSIWWVMPITEILALAYVASCLRKQTL